MFLFFITFLTEAVFHFSDLSVKLVLSCMKEYFFDGVGVFLAISPIIAFVARIKKGYWVALVLAEIYSCAALFAGMSSVLQIFFPINAVFNFSGYQITTIEKRVGSTIILLLCGCLSALLLKGMKRREKDN